MWNVAYRVFLATFSNFLKSEYIPGRSFMSFSLRMYASYVGSNLASSWCRGVTKISQELPEVGVEKGRNPSEMKVITLQNSLY